MKIFQIGKTLALKKRLRTFSRSSNAFFLGLLIIAFFLIFPQRGNFGDDGNIFIIFVSNVIEYLESGHEEPFFEYLKNQHSEFHQDKLMWGEAGHYKVTGMYGLLTAPVQDFNVSIILSRMMELSLYHLFLKQLDLEQCIVIYIFIVFIGTFVFAYKFGKEIVDKNFGIILAVVIVSNIYVAQLYRTFLFSHIAIYPLLFLMSFYYLLSLHNVENIKKGPAVTGLSIAIALSFLNGYPNTNFVLLGLLATFFMFFLFYMWLRKGQFKIVKKLNYVYVLLGSITLILLVAGIWSTLLGYDFLYALKVIFRTRTWGMIFEGNLKYNVLTEYGVTYVTQKVLALLRLLFTESNYIYGAHEPSFLLHLNFLNIIEKCFLIGGTLFWLKNILSKKLINFFLLFVFVFFWVRAISHKSGAPIGRTEFDFIFVVLFFLSYGIYGFIQYFKKKTSGTPDSTSIASNIFSGKNFLYLILIMEVIINGFIFNYYFVYKYNESLGLHNGAYQLRKLYREEISGKNNFLVLDFSQSTYYKYHIDNISLLQGDITYLSLEKFLEKFKRPEDFRKFLRENSDSKFYFIFPNNVERVASGAYRTDIRASIIRFYRYISIYDHYKIIKNRQGVPLFFVWKVSDSNLYSFLNLDKNKAVYNIDLNHDEKLKYIDFPSSVKKVVLESGGQTLNLDFSKFYFNRYHFSFNDKSVIEIFNNFSADNKISNIVKKDAKEGGEKLFFYGIKVDLLQPTKQLSHVDFQYDVGVPVKNIYFHIPFLFFNDKDLVNSFSVLLKTEKNAPWKKIFNKRSNGSLLISDNKSFELYDIFDSHGNVAPLGSNHTNFFNGVIDTNMGEEISIRYQMTIFKKYVRPYSLTWHEESSPNQLIFNVDTSKYSEFLNQSGKNIKLTVEFREKLKFKFSGMSRDYILGYGISK